MFELIWFELFGTSMCIPTRFALGYVYGGFVCDYFSCSFAWISLCMLFILSDFHKPFLSISRLEIVMGGDMHFFVKQSSWFHTLNKNWNMLLIVLSYNVHTFEYDYFLNRHPGNIVVDGVNGGRLMFYDFATMGK